jgi:hypothetical protein
MVGEAAFVQDPMHQCEPHWKNLLGSNLLQLLRVSALQEVVRVCLWLLAPFPIILQ